jgi:hypothetical protein
MDMKTTALSLALIALAAATAMAQVPRTINYQGRVSDAAGPLNGDHTMTLKIYDAESGGNLLHTETQNVTFKNGIFTVAIGAGRAGGIDPRATFDKQLWMGVAISGFNGGQEITPRYILRSSPYSLRSSVSDSSVSAANAAQATRAASALKADSATNVVAPLTMLRNKNGEALTVINNGGSAIYAQGSPYAITSNGVDSSGSHFISGESLGATKAPAAGGYYRDNAPVAWATIARNGTVISDFGVKSVTLNAADSSYLIVFDRPLASTAIGAANAPDIAPIITVGGLPNQFTEVTPVYAYWTFHQSATKDYDLDQVVVHINAFQAAGQGSAVTRPFSIVVFGRP